MSASTQNSKQRVLLVDSDHRTNSRLAELLREDGFEVDVARDGAAAIALLARAPAPDALVTELNVRFADGVAIARYARAQRPSLPVMVVTRHPHLLRLDALGGGPAPLVLTKPVDYSQLLSALREATPESAPAPTTTLRPAHAES
ncbi:MAG TPA: response regulator [Polyangiaceae bacterium]|nr:response regulator [Polyangiaceae bacterium]